MVSTKVYKDGDRFIIVVDSPDGKVLKKINDFLYDLYGFADLSGIEGVSSIKCQDASAIVPDESKEITKEQAKERPFSEPISKESALALSIPDMGITLGDAIKNKDTIAVVRMFTSTKSLDKSASDTIKALCSEYILTDLKSREPAITSTSCIEEFFSVYEPLLKDAVQEILNLTGYENLETFFSTAYEFIQQDLYESVINMMIRELS